MLNPDYREMLSALCDAEADFIIVGAFSLAVHGNPRATGDIDILIRPSEENAGKVMAALRVFGAPLDQITPANLLHPGTVIQIGIVPRRIDILTALEGIADFDEAWETHIVAEVEDLNLPVLGRDTLIRNKSAFERPQDLADVAWLVANKE